MARYKNKKKLTTLTLLLLLTFLVGAAFAATPGALQVAGVIGVGDPQLRVRWETLLYADGTGRAPT
jgi:hypothetical protein